MDETESLFKRKAIDIPTPRDLDAVEEAAMQLVLEEGQGAPPALMAAAS